jgi:PKD repeat protein
MTITRRVFTQSLLMGALLGLTGCGGGGGSGGAAAAPVNRAPTASFVATPSAAAPLTVQVDATASSDPDGTIATYAWDFGDGRAANGAAATASHQYQAAGTYTIRLTVADRNGAQGTATRQIRVAGAQRAQWLGEYESSLLGTTALYSEISQAGTALSGTYRDAFGREGTLSGSVSGVDVTLRFTDTTPACPGTFDATGVIDTTIQPGNDTIVFQFTGSSCDGNHAGGSGYLILQKSRVLAWGQHVPSQLIVRNGSMFWTDDSFDAVKKLDLATGAITALAHNSGSGSFLTLAGANLLWSEGFHDYGNPGCDGSGGRLRLMTSGVDGSNLRTLTTGDLCGDSTAPRRVLADGAFAYWAPSQGNLGSVIERVPLAGGDAVRIADPGNGFRYMAIDQSHVYWSEVVGNESSKILRCPLSGCGAQSPQTVLLTDATIVLWSNLAIVGDRLVFAIKRVGQLGYEVSSMPKAGGAITDLAHADDQVPTVLADAGAVFWLSNNALFSAPLAGGAATMLANSFYYVQDIVVGSARLYWADASFQGGFPDAIYSVAKSGGAVTRLASRQRPEHVQVDAAGNVFYADGATPGTPGGIYRMNPAGDVTPVVIGMGGSIAVDAQFLYSREGNNIKRVSQDGGDAEVVGIISSNPIAMDQDEAYVDWIDATGNVVRLPQEMTGANAYGSGPSSGVTGGFDIHQGYAYWSILPDRLYRTPVDGGTIETLADDLALPTNLVVDDQFVYVIEADANRVTKIPVAGGPRSTFTDTDSYFGWYTLIQDANNIYWASPAGLFRAAKSNGAQTQYAVPVLQDQFGRAPSIVVDDQYLYWTEMVSGAIKREPK